MNGEISSFMPNETYYSDIKIIKKPLKQRIKSILIFLCVILVGIGCYGVAYFLSSALTVGNLGAFVVFGDTKIKIKAKTYYAVTLGEYDDRLKAEQVALGANIQGAGGYIWEDDKYWVIGNVYSSMSDAEKVKENLKESKYSVDIKEITTQNLNLNMDMYEQENMNTINSAFEIFDSIYDSLYDYSVRFDKGEITNLAVSSGLSELKGKVKGIIIDVQNLLIKGDSVLSRVQSSLVMSDELLDQTIIKTMDNSGTNYSLKYSVASIVRIRYELFSKLK